MAGFNWFDIVIIVALLAGLALGYSQGVIRQLMSLVALYIALVLATQFFRGLSQLISNILRVQPNTFTNMIAFFVIFIVAFVLINLLVKDAYRATHIRVAPLFDHLGGMAFGLVSAWIIISVSISVLLFAVAAQGWLQAEGLRKVLESGVTDSRLAQLTESSLPVIIATVEPWLPNGLPALFNSK